MRLSFLSLLLIITTLTAGAQQYNPVKLFDLATAADLVTYGTIIKIDNRYYYLDCFSERRKKITIPVVKYAGHNGSYRWNKYEAGQRVFVFLKKNGPEYNILSPGIEGEVPIIKDSLVIDMMCFTPKIVQGLAPAGKVTPQYRNAQTFAVGSQKVFGLRFTPKYLYESIMAFRDCYQVILKRPNTFPSFTCFNFFDRYTREKIDVQKRRSKLMKLMYIDMEEAQLRNCK